MRVLALDLGSKRIGLAVSDPLGITAQGLKTIEREPHEQCIDNIKSVISELGVDELVIGLPLNMDGTKGKEAEGVSTFAKELEERIEKPVKLWDERLTTMEAERVLLSSDISRKKRKGARDKLAAQLILQSYLSAQGEKNV